MSQKSANKLFVPFQVRLRMVVSIKELTFKIKPKLIVHASMEVLPARDLLIKLVSGQHVFRSLSDSSLFFAVLVRNI